VHQQSLNADQPNFDVSMTPNAITKASIFHQHQQAFTLTLYLSLGQNRFIAIETDPDPNGLERELSPQIRL
jgi:hypothetical protein